MPTLVLAPRYSDDSNTLWRAAFESGWDVVRLRGFGPPPADLCARDPVFYGETLVADAVREALGVCLLEPDAPWLPTLPERYRLRAVRLTTLGEARALADRSFIKCTDEKFFQARVYETGGAELRAHTTLDDELPVLVADPVRFEVEFRCFVLDRTIATASLYLRDGALARDAQSGEWLADPAAFDAATAFATQVLADGEVALPAAVVMDVGRIEGRGWAVIEANACWASGLYNCDPLAALPVVRRATVPSGALAPDDRRWVRTRALELVP